MAYRVQPFRVAALLLALCCFHLPLRASVGATPAFQAVDFGSVVVGSAIPVVQSLTFSFTNASFTPAFALRYHQDFSLAQPSCTGSGTLTCTILVHFAPQYPGLREDGIEIEDTQGNALAVALVHGIGMAPQAVVRPGPMTNFVGTGGFGNTGDNGPATAATVGNPQSVVVDQLGNVYFSDSLAQVVRRVDAATQTITTVAGSSTATALGDGGPATGAMLSSPASLAIDGAGNLFIADSGDNRVRKVDSISGRISTVAGNGTAALGGDGQAATGASLHGPAGLALDANGNLYIADTYNNRIRKVTPAGIISTIAGGGTPGPGADGIGNGGPATNAIFHLPSGIAFDSAGNLYIADTGANLIRQVSVSGIISVVAGAGTPGYSGNGGAALNAELNQPTAVAVDAGGDLYIADSNNSVVRAVSAASILTTIGGEGQVFAASTNGTLATSTPLNNPAGVALAASGNIYITDQGNRLLHRIAVNPSSLTFAATGVGSVSAAQILTLANEGNLPLSVSALSLSGQFVQQSSGNADCSSATVLASGTSCSFAVALAPQAAGAQTGSVHISTNSLNATNAQLTIALTGTATASSTAQPTASLASLSFNNQPIGTASAPQTVTITNHGSASITTQSLWLSGTNSADFTIVGAPCSVLTPGASCTVSVTFTPQATGPRTATLGSTESTGGSSPTLFEQSVYLTGTVTSQQPALSPATLSFSGYLHSPTAAQVVTLSNGSAVPLALQAIVLSGTSDFTLGANTCGTSIAPHASCTLAMTFTASEMAPETATLRFSDALGSSAFTQTLSLIGSGSLQPPSVSPGAVAFASSPLQRASAVQTATLSNGGQVPLTINSISISGAPDFAKTGSTCGATLPPAASCTVTLAFTPSISGPRSATLQFADSAVGSSFSQNVALSGVGLNSAVSPPPAPSLTVSPTTIAFGQTGLGITSAAQTVTVTNPSGTAVLPISLTGSTDFAIATNNCSGTAASCLVSLTYTPTVGGPQTATLSVGNTQATVALTGSGPTQLRFVPVAPCRVVDTRNPNGPFGGPEMETNSSRSFAVPQSTCGIPASAAAYSLNVTVAPDPILGYLSIWPTGQQQPYVSTLNSDGRVKANAAIVGAGTSGGVSIYVSNKSHVIIDIDGYFADAETSGSLSFYPVAPCRVVDTRNPAGPLGGPTMSAGQSRSFPVPTSTCNIPASAGGYSLNYTVVPKGTFGYLTTWPTGQLQPYVSTLNAFTGVVTANSAIVPAGTDGSISAFVTDAADLVIDINGYFAAPSSNGLSLYPLAPCRVLDTRSPTNPKTFIDALTVPVKDSGCALPAGAQAYVTNATVIPNTVLGFLALWPDGLSQPLVSTLNAFDGAITSNMAIVPTSNGSVDAYASHKTDLILDVSAYFAP